MEIKDKERPDQSDRLISSLMGKFCPFCVVIVRLAKHKHMFSEAQFQMINLCNIHDWIHVRRCCWLEGVWGGGVAGWGGSPPGWCGLNWPWKRFWSRGNYCTLKAAEKTH